ncbi:MAG: DNA methyltransferase, partial [Pseudomonadota bacterium]|nr:DNA methyltransferase [Pseudomonadota bacterium]
ECMRRPIRNNTRAGEAVYDPFLGSGSTLIAAESEGRVCLAIELNPLYIDVAIRRWQAFTGRQARLGPEGPAYDQVAAERVPVSVAI